MKLIFTLAVMVLLTTGGYFEGRREVAQSVKALCSPEPEVNDKFGPFPFVRKRFNIGSDAYVCYHIGEIVQ